MDFWVPLLVNAVGVWISWEALKIARMQAGISPKTPQLKMYWPVAACIVLATSAWIPYWIAPDDLPEWPNPKPPYFENYGIGANGDCEVMANGDRFLKYREHYRLAAACYAYTGLGDILDVPNLQISNAYDIRGGLIVMKILWSPVFTQIVRAPVHPDTIHHVALLLPSGVEPSQFSTFRQARSLGVKLVNVGGNRIGEH